jgi:predicted aconitase with swiveling domain
MKRYLVQLKVDTKIETAIVNTRREVIATVGRFLASTPNPCMMLIMRRKKEVKHVRRGKTKHTTTAVR